MFFVQTWRGVNVICYTLHKTVVPNCDSQSTMMDFVLHSLVIRLLEWMQLCDSIPRLYSMCPKKYYPDTFLLAQKERDKIWFYYLKISNWGGSVNMIFEYGDMTFFCWWFLLIFSVKESVKIDCLKKTSKIIKMEVHSLSKLEDETWSSNKMELLLSHPCECCIKFLYDLLVTKSFRMILNDTCKTFHT